MKKIFVLIAILCTTIIMYAQHQTFPHVVITEIMADPTPLVGLPDFEYVEIYNVSSDFTYNFGFSLGGAVSAAIAREVELDPELDRTMHIKKSICGGGPYDPNALLEHYSSIPDDSIAYPIVIICALEGARDENPAMREAYSDTILYSRKLSHVLVIVEQHGFTELAGQAGDFHIHGQRVLRKGFGRFRQLVQRDRTADMLQP